MINKKITAISLSICLAVLPLFHVHAATRAVEERRAPVPTLFSTNLSAEQIDNLMAPIALYPDPLIAQMLPASTYVDEIDKAARYLRANNNQTTGVDNQSWDVSVRSIAHYPQVVYTMSEKLDWTTAIGQAYVTQAVDVFGSIQRLRHKAKKYGYLKTTPQQTVIEEKDVIKIVPAQAQYIYVPTYNPQVVYVEAPSSGPSTSTVVATAAIAFTAGLLIGAWLNNDCNWYSHTVYYHGWRGVGWVSHSTTVIRVGGSPYVNARYSTVRYNTAVLNRNVNYNNVSHYNNVSRNVNYNNVNVNRNVNVNNVNVNRNVNNVNVNNNVNNKNLNRNVSTNNVNNAAYRGKTATPTQTNANRASAQQRTSGFGSYGNRSQTNAQSSRGQKSRASKPATTRTQPTRSGGRKK
ncbi:MAG: DUF3300 domain-containing protein [Acidobacteria bacterium]|nr:DUF3300 domain-containing protein [Acidobacteriota bacterium]